MVEQSCASQHSSRYRATSECPRVVGMQKAEFIPVNFRISPEAAAKLHELTELASQTAARSMIPALFWAEEYDEIKRKTVVLGLSIGWFYLDDIPARLLQKIDGVTLTFLIGQKKESHFNAKTVDFQGDKFFLAS